MAITRKEIRSTPGTRSHILKGGFVLVGHVGENTGESETLITQSGKSCVRKCRGEIDPIRCHENEQFRVDMRSHQETETVKKKEQPC